MINDNILNWFCVGVAVLAVFGLIGGIIQLKRDTKAKDTAQHRVTVEVD
ncbi:MAG: hypothetical protein JOZ57_08105 [Abitibacteriaceae bacterium]|nr:hypothetical protein [Abditibacteriaceae bacterium]